MDGARRLSSSAIRFAGLVSNGFEFIGSPCICWNLAATCFKSRFRARL
jgi:hypothetical protein